MRRLLLALPVLVAVLVGAVVLVGQNHETEPEPEVVEVASTAPRFTSLAELVHGSDLIVLAEVAGVERGRALTAPGDTESGVITQLAELRVVYLLAGNRIESVVLEEEATLLDGTPIVVDGVTPVQPGQRGVFFLVAGTTDGAPNHALVGPQGRFLVAGDALEASTDDPLANYLADLGGPTLVDQIDEIIAAASAVE